MGPKSRILQLTDSSLTRTNNSKSEEMHDAQQLIFCKKKVNLRLLNRRSSFLWTLTEGLFYVDVLSYNFALLRSSVASFKSLCLCSSRRERIVKAGFVLVTLLLHVHDQFQQDCDAFCVLEIQYCRLRVIWRFLWNVTYQQSCLRQIHNDPI